MKIFRKKKFFNNKLEKSSSVLFKWFNDNYTDVHSDKSQFLISDNKKGIINIDNDSINTEDVHELLGIIIEPRLTFENRIDKLYKKVSQKLYALARISNYNKRKVLIKLSLNQSYWSLVWIFHIERFYKK